MEEKGKFFQIKECVRYAIPKAFMLNIRGQMIKNDKIQQQSIMETKNKHQCKMCGLRFYGPVCPKCGWRR